MTAKEIVRQLRALGREPYRKILRNHGINEPVLGVKIEELKKIKKRVGKDWPLASELYETGIYDAQYLAGLIADETMATPKDLRGWLKTANSAAACGFVVAAVAADSPHGWTLGREWIDSKDERTAQSGWITLTGVMGVRDDSELDLAELKRLLKRVGRSIHEQPNLVRYAMNGFVIGAGTFVAALTDAAVQTAEQIGEVTVDMGPTECQVPLATAYLRKRSTAAWSVRSARAPGAEGDRTSISCVRAEPGLRRVTPPRGESLLRARGTACSWRDGHGAVRGSRPGWCGGRPRPARGRTACRCSGGSR
jgi:3-methyladenine DNA glycosylase AlkD